MQRKRTHREVQVRLARHNQPFGLDASQRALEAVLVVCCTEQPLPNKRDIARLPGMEQRDQVVRVPRPKEATLPLSAQEVVERGVFAVKQVSVLAEPL